MAYNSPVGESNTKWYFLLVLIIGGAAVLLLATGNFGPMADARAKQITLDAENKAAQDKLDVETKQKLQAEAIAQQAALDAEQLDVQKRLSDQQVAQAQTSFEHWELLKEAAVWVLAWGVIAALLIAASAFALNQFVAWRKMQIEANIERLNRAIEARLQTVEQTQNEWATAIIGLRQELNRNLHISAQNMEQRIAELNGGIAELQTHLNDADLQTLNGRLSQLESALAVLQMLQLQHGTKSNGRSRGDALDLRKTA